MSTIQKKYPKGVYALFNLQVFGMAGFSVITSLLVLYCTNRLGFSNSHAYSLMAAFYALIFATSVPGGYLAQRFLGYGFATCLSVFLTAGGMVLMSLAGRPALYAGISLFLLGSGIMVPCLYILLGELFKKDSTYREGGFMLSYVGMNLGGFLVSSLSGTIADSIGYRGAFLLGAVLTLMMLIIYMCVRKRFVQDKQIFSQRLYGVVLLILLLPVLYYLVDKSQMSNFLLLILGGACVGYIVCSSLSLKGLARQNILLYLALFLGSAVFWSLSALSYSALTIFTEHNVNRSLFGLIVPTADFMGLNPLFIILCGPLLTVLWRYLNKKGFTVSSAQKFSGGLCLMGVGFLVLVFAIQLSNQAGCSALVFLVLSYFFQTTGELLIGPIGYALIGKLVPVNKEGGMMGMWQMASGVGGALSYYFAEFSVSNKGSMNPLVTNARYNETFLVLGLLSLGVGVALWLLCKAYFSEQLA